MSLHGSASSLHSTLRATVSGCPGGRCVASSVRGPARRGKRLGPGAEYAEQHRAVSEGFEGFLLRPRDLERSSHQGRDPGLPVSCLRPTEESYVPTPLSPANGYVLKTPILNMVLDGNDTQDREEGSWGWHTTHIGPTAKASACKSLGLKVSTLWAPSCNHPPDKSVSQQP